MKTIHNLLSEKEGTIIHAPRFETELLLAHALKKTRAFVLAHPEYPVTKNVLKTFLSYLERRNNHEPIALITGHKEFYGREFFVNEHTLVPRPETELLIEKILDSIADETLSMQESHEHKKHSILILDVGTGSGNIITTIAKELEMKMSGQRNFTFIASDLSKEALRIAKKNASRHHVKKNIRFMHSDMLQKIPKKLFHNATSIYIAANLPYLSEKEFHDAPTDVRMFEPKSALESGPDGLDHYRSLFKELRALSQKPREASARITLFLEISPSQKTPISSLIESVFPNAKQSFFKDLSKKWRLAHITLVSPSQEKRAIKKEKERE